MTARRHLDKYYTPVSATQELQRHVTLTGNVLECCAGTGAIANELKGPITVWTNDIDQGVRANFYIDVAQDPWYLADHEFDWIVTNPPFNQAAKIIPLAYDYAQVGIAMLLRLSYLEPCFDRAEWLKEHPPTKLIVLPRISFTGNGKTDNVTCAWMVWMKNVKEQQIVVVPR